MPNVEYEVRFSAIIPPSTTIRVRKADGSDWTDAELREIEEQIERDWKAEEHA